MEAAEILDNMGIADKVRGGDGRWRCRTVGKLVEIQENGDSRSSRDAG